MRKRVLRGLLGLGLLRLLGLTSPAAAQDPQLAKDMVRDVEGVVQAASGRWALIVGVELYDDENIMDLRFADDDAKAMAEALIAGGAFQPDHVVVMSSDAANAALRPTRNNILLQLERLKVLDGAELVVAYFSGHGLGASDGSQRQNYIVAMDSNIEIPQQTAISVEYIIRTLSEVPARRRAIIFDACRNQLRTNTRGGLPEAFGDPSYSLSEGTQVLYCTRFGDVSFEDPERQHGACTGLLLEGLEGRADGAAGSPPDAVVSTRELSGWLEQRLPALSFGGAHQTPYFTGDFTGAFALAAARLPPPPDGVPRPGGPLFNLTLEAGLGVALQAHRSGERVDFLSARREIMDALPGLTEPITKTNAVDLHRMQLVHRANVQDHEGALAELRAVSELAPGRPPLDGLDPLPPLLKGVSAPVEDGPLGPRERLPRGVSLWVDGEKAKARPEERPAITQAVNCGAAREVQWTRELMPGEPLPPINRPDLAACRVPAQRGLAVGAGASLAASGASLAIGLVQMRRFYDSLDGYTAADLPAEVEAEAERHERLANLFSRGSGGLAVVGIGLGVGWVALKF